MIGENHKKIFNWLEQTWIPYGNKVCILEGFPGVGKTFLSQKIAQSFEGTSVFITATEASKESMEEVIFDLAFELDLQGNNKLVDAIDTGKNLRNTLTRILQEPILIIIDEFQEILGSNEEILPKDWSLFLRGLTSRPSTKGKLLILTNRTVKHTKWAEHIDVKILKGFNVKDGELYLNNLLKGFNRESEISPEQKEGIIRLLGGNPRAIKLLISSLTFNSLEDLIKITEESWEYKGRYFSPELVEKLEIRLLKNILNHISDEDELILRKISVLRKSFKRQVFGLFLDERHLQNQFKKRIVELFLIEQYQGWFKLNPIVREVELNKLYEFQPSLIDAHKLVSRYYTRHFHGKNIVGKIGNLGAYFNEAKFHLSFQENDEELDSITYVFTDYIKKTISGSSPVPKTQQALNERIAVLSSLLQKPGPKGLEYHLAKLYSTRRKNDDLVKAIVHGKRSLSPKIPDYWILTSKLLSESNRKEEAIDLLKDGINKIAADKHVVALYQACAELLSESNRKEEAIDLLKDGINKIPADKHVVALYHSCAEILSNSNKKEEAIDLLKDGINKIPADKSLYLLYKLCARLLNILNRNQEAIQILKEGINEIPSNHAGGSLIEYCAFYFLGDGNHYELNQLKNKTNKVSRYEYSLIEILINIQKQNWQKILDDTQRYRESYPSYLPITMQIAFAWLFSGNPTKSIEILNSHPKKIGSYNENPVNWLKSSIFYTMEQYDLANKSLSDYYGYQTNLNEKEIKIELYGIWKNNNSTRNNVNLYFPKLLPILSIGNEFKTNDKKKDSVNNSDNILSMKVDEPSQKILQKKISESNYDVFLCHNSQNKETIKCIGNQLKEFGLLPWLDEWEIVPGRPWQDALENQIKNIKSVAVFIGPEGIGPWQHSEMNAFLRKFHQKQIPIIPVILPTCQKTPELPVFLEGFHWVDFRKESPNPYHQLLWGITGTKPEILLSTLSESPIIKINNQSLIEDIKKVIQDEILLLRNEVLAKADEETSKVIDKLNETQLSTTSIIIKSIEEYKIDDSDMKDLLDGIKELKSNPPNNKEINQALEKVTPIIDDTKFGVDHKLKLTIPIIPAILSYQGEYKLSSGLNFSEVIYRIAKKVYPKLK